MKVTAKNTQIQIKSKLLALEIRRCFDTNNFQDILYRTRDYRDFLTLKLKNSTIADIAYFEEINQKPLRYPQKFKTNIENIKTDSIVKYMQDIIQSRQGNLFPKTARLRNILIKKDRFSLDYVKPKLDSKWQKFVIKFMSVI